MGIIDSYLKNIQSKSNSNGMQPAVNTYEPLKTTNAIAAPRSSAQEASTGGRSMSDIQERTFPKDEVQKGTQAYSSLQGQPPSGPSTAQQIGGYAKQVYNAAKLGNQAYNALGLGVPTAAEAALTASTPEAAFILNDMGAATAAGYSGGAEMGAVGAEIGAEAGVGATAGISSAISSVATPVAIVGAVEMARGIWGGPGLEYDDMTKQQRTVDSPATSTLGMPLQLAGDDTLVGDIYKATSAGERIVAAPIDWLFGDENAFDNKKFDDIAEVLGTVICTELHRQGILPDDIYAADCEYEKFQDNDLMDGYRLWGAPLADKMKTNKLLTKCVSFFAVPWAHQMSYEMGVGDKGSLFGKVLMTVMYPPVRLIGKIRHYQGLIRQRGLY